MAEAKYSNSNGIVNGDKDATTEVKANGHLPSEPTYPSHPRTSSSLRRGCSAKGSPPMRIAMSVRAKTASTSSDGSSHEIKLSERRTSRDREKMGGMLDGGVGSGGVREEEGTAERPESREAQERDIAQVLLKYNEEVHTRGESLPAEMQVYRVKVVTAFLRAAVPLSKLVCVLPRFIGRKFIQAQ